MVEQAAQQRAAAAVLLADARAESARVAAQAQRRERLSKERTAQAELEATARARSVAVEERAGVLRQAEVQVEELVAAAAQRAADEREAVLREAGPSCAPRSIYSRVVCAKYPRTLHPGATASGWLTLAIASCRARAARGGSSACD